MGSYRPQCRPLAESLAAERRSSGESLAGAALQQHLDDGFLTQQAGYVSLTTEGLLIADTIIPDLF